MEKNVIVMDEQGMEYEATYPKRARGLVKKGRARFVNEHTICLACPPNFSSEETMMSDLIEKKQPETTIQKQPSLDACAAMNETLTLSDILARLEALRADTACFNATVKGICQVEPTCPEDLCAREKVAALGAALEAHEATKQKLISFYEKVYDRLWNRSLSEKENVLDLIQAAAGNEKSLAALSELLGVVQKLN